MSGIIASIEKIPDFKDDFRANKARVYFLFRNEKEEVQKFMDKHLKKDYIRPLKLPQTSPVFFVEKKNKEKCMVINYRSVRV